jgi:nucleoid DNA-binding protein
MVVLFLYQGLASRKARQGRNPKTGDIIPIPPGKKVSFKPTTLRKII